MSSKIANNDYFLSLCSKFFTIIFGFVSLIFLNRYLGAELKGQYSTILNYVTIISAILQFGISAIYPRFKRKKIENCYEIFLSLSILQFALYLVPSLFLILFFSYNTEILYVSVISAISILTTQLRYINLVEDMKRNATVVFIMSLVNCILTVAAYLLAERDLTVALAIFVAKDLTVIVLYATKINYYLLFRKNYLKHYIDILKEGFLPMLSGLLIMLNYKIDIIMLNLYSVSFASIGIYALGLSIAEYMWIIPDVFKDVVQKRTAKDNSISTINFSLRCSTSIIVVVFLITLVAGKQMFSIVFGEEYIEAFNITMILFIGILAIIYYKIIGQLFISDNKSKQYFLILLAGAIINIVVNYFVIPVYGIYGAAFASVLSYGGIGILFLALYAGQYKVKMKDILILKRNDFENAKRFIIRKSK